MSCLSKFNWKPIFILNGYQSYINFNLSKDDVSYPIFVKVPHITNTLVFYKGVTYDADGNEFTKLKFVIYHQMLQCWGGIDYGNFSFYAYVDKENKFFDFLPEVLKNWISPSSQGVHPDELPF